MGGTLEYYEITGGCMWSLFELAFFLKPGFVFITEIIVFKRKDFKFIFQIFCFRFD